MLERRKLSRRETVLVTALALTVVALAVWALRPAGALPLLPPRATTETPGPPIARIDLARLDAPRPEGEAGRRNLFDFGERGAPEATPAPVIVLPRTPPPGVQGSATGTADDFGSGSGTPLPPPLNVKYIGSVESAGGMKVAVLVTDRQEVLVGQPGQLLANRYRIARIGLESVDLEDVATGQSRRIPLRGS